MAAKEAGCGFFFPHTPVFFSFPYPYFFGDLFLDNVSCG
jgi:hypothetical protein